MAYNPQKTREWGLDTPNSGLFLNAEFDRIYENFNAIVPVGSIIPWLPGYFTNSNNNGFTEVPVFLSDFWKVCDGSELNDPQSPIFNGSGRFLPKLNDDRFLMGSTVMGSTGGANEVQLTVDQIPSHNHSISHTHGTGSTSSEVESQDHTHWRLSDHVVEETIYDVGVSAWEICHATNFWSPFRKYVSSITGNQNNKHTHPMSVDLGSYVGNSGNTGGSNSVNNLPKYLACKYIMRIK